MEFLNKYLNSFDLRYEHTDPVPVPVLCPERHLCGSPSEAAHLGVTGDKAPLFSGFWSLGPDLGIASLWLGFRMPCWCPRFICLYSGLFAWHAFTRLCSLRTRLLSLHLGGWPVHCRPPDTPHIWPAAPGQPASSKVCWVLSSSGCRK